MKIAEKKSFVCIEIMFLLGCKTNSLLQTAIKSYDFFSGVDIWQIYYSPPTSKTEPILW
jgi:hypothetical protein